MLVNSQRIRSGETCRVSQSGNHGRTCYTSMQITLIKLSCHDRPDLRVINMIVGDDPEPAIEELDRVIVWCIVDSGSNFIVDRVPTQG
jgi:hypothetical protein